MVTNGMQNGMANGMVTNGMSNGMVTNGMQNGMANGMVTNGMQNGMANGMVTNGMQNGNGMGTNGMTGKNMYEMTYTNNNSNNNNIMLNYYQNLLNELYQKKCLNYNDINNIKNKLDNNKLSLDNAIRLLEKLKEECKNSNDLIYGENNQFNKPIGDKIANEWSQDYTILNTDKWQVPVERPPLCVNTAPCNVCPMESSNYPVNLLHWKESSNITDNIPKINKDWIKDKS
jgi:hypothetical protein